MRERAQAGGASGAAEAAGGDVGKDPRALAQMRARQAARQGTDERETSRAKFWLSLVHDYVSKFKGAEVLPVFGSKIEDFEAKLATVEATLTDDPAVAETRARFEQRKAEYTAGFQLVVEQAEKAMGQAGPGAPEIKVAESWAQKAPNHPLSQKLRAALANGAKQPTKPEPNNQKPPAHAEPSKAEATPAADAKSGPDHHEAAKPEHHQAAKPEPTGGGHQAEHDAKPAAAGGDHHAEHDAKPAEGHHEGGHDAKPADGAKHHHDEKEERAELDEKKKLLREMGEGFIAKYELGSARVELGAATLDSAVSLGLPKLLGALAGPWTAITLPAIGLVEKWQGEERKAELEHFKTTLMTLDFVEDPKRIDFLLAKFVEWEGDLYQLEAYVDQAASLQHHKKDPGEVPKEIRDQQLAIIEIMQKTCSEPDRVDRDITPLVFQIKDPKVLAELMASVTENGDADVTEARAGAAIKPEHAAAPSGALVAKRTKLLALMSERCEDGDGADQALVSGVQAISDEKQLDHIREQVEAGETKHEDLLRMVGADPVEKKESKLQTIGDLAHDVYEHLQKLGGEGAEGGKEPEGGGKAASELWENVSKVFKFIGIGKELPAIKAHIEGGQDAVLKGAMLIGEAKRKQAPTK